MVTLLTKHTSTVIPPYPADRKYPPTLSRKGQVKEDKGVRAPGIGGAAADVQRQAATSEFGKGEAPASKQSSQAHCGSPLQRGEKRGGGGGAERGSKQKR